jgi:hypothetical protein
MRRISSGSRSQPQPSGLEDDLSIIHTSTFTIRDAAMISLKARSGDDMDQDFMDVIGKLHLLQVEMRRIQADRQVNVIVSMVLTLNPIWISAKILRPC